MYFFKDCRGFFFDCSYIMNCDSVSGYLLWCRMFVNFIFISVVRAVRMRYTQRYPFNSKVLLIEQTEIDRNNSEEKMPAHTPTPTKYTHTHTHKSLLRFFVFIRIPPRYVRVLSPHVVLNLQWISASELFSCMCGQFDRLNCFVRS